MTSVYRLIGDANAGFKTRHEGSDVRSQIEKVLAKTDDMVAIDFSGVAVMTPSFADECFGKLAQELGIDEFKKRIRLRGADETIRVLMNFVLSERLSTRDS